MTRKTYKMSAATTAAHSAKNMSGGHMNSDKMRQESITMDMLEVRTDCSFASTRPKVCRYDREMLAIAYAYCILTTPLVGTNHRISCF